MQTEYQAKLLGYTASFGNSRFSFYLTIDVDTGEPDARRLRHYINSKYAPSVTLANLAGHFMNDAFLKGLIPDAVDKLNEAFDLVADIAVNVTTEDRVWNGKTMTDIKSIYPRRDIKQQKHDDGDETAPIVTVIPEMHAPVQTILKPIDPEDVQF